MIPGRIIAWGRGLLACRSRALAAAIWAWWLCLGAWSVPPVMAAMALLGILAVTLAFSRGRPWWPPDRTERIPLLAAGLLALNGLCWHKLGLTPRLSMLTAPPLLWTLARLAAWPALLSAGFSRRAFAWLERNRKGATWLALGLFNGWFASVAVLHVRSLNMDYWDMGSIGQAMANCARGRGFISTDPAGFADSRFAARLVAHAKTPLTSDCMNPAESC